MSVENVTAREDHDKMFQLIMAAWGSQVIRTLAVLSVAEHLEAEPLTAKQIAERESSDERAAIELIACNWKTRARQMNAYLMTIAGARSHLHKRKSILV